MKSSKRKAKSTLKKEEREQIAAAIEALAARIPPTIQINGNPWTIVLTEPRDMPFPNALGYSHDMRKTIAIRNDLDNEQKIFIFFHEFVHSCMACMNNTADGMRGKVDMEAVCNLVANNWRPLLENAEEIFAYLQQGE